MDMFTPMQIAASGLNAQRQRMTAIASNLANAETTRTENGGPYQRLEVVLEAVSIDAFQQLLAQESGTGADTTTSEPGDLDGFARFVRVSSVVDGSPPVLRYMPGHPDANEAGYVELPDISVIKEMANMTLAQRSYEANLAVIKTTMSMIERSLQIIA